MKCKKATNLKKADFFPSVFHVFMTRSVEVNSQPGQREKVPGQTKKGWKGNIGHGLSAESNVPLVGV